MRAFSAMWDQLRGLTGRSRHAAKRCSKKSASAVLQGRRALLECLEERALLSIDGPGAEQPALTAAPRVWLSDDVLAPPTNSVTGPALAPTMAGAPSPSLAPYGATDWDTSEYMAGDVYVTVVLFESNGGTDDNTENWNTTLVNNVKSEVEEAFTWWELTAQNATTVASTLPLDFTIDFTYTDSPVSTGYEPITRPSSDEYLWISQFLARVGHPAYGGDVYSAVKEFDAAQRDAHDCDWAITVFVANSQNDGDGVFADGYFGYAYLGGPYITLTYDNDGWGIGNMGMVLAHEVGHTFYALDEYTPQAGYSDSGSYYDFSGYYNVQNLNAYRDNPNPSSRVPSLMADEDLQFAAYSTHTSSPTSLQTVGLRDSDADGILDVLDVPLTLTGAGTANESTRTYTFTGVSAVQTLPNQNPSSGSLGNDITLNTVDLIQYRLDGGDWINGNAYGGAVASVGQTVAVTPGEHTIEFRTICSRTGVVSAVWSDSFDMNLSFSGVVWNDLNANGTRDSGEPGLPGRTVFVDLNDDGDPDFGEPMATTDIAGAYRFTLAPGEYTVHEVLPNGWIRTKPADPDDHYHVTGAVGEAVSGYDFGNVQPGRISGRVRNDVDGDRSLETGEGGLAGWTVFLDAGPYNGTLDAGETRTTTDADGNYSFTLLPGTYRVTHVVQAGWQRTVPILSSYTEVTVLPGTTSTVDFGDHQIPGSIAGIVWNDVNHNGIRDLKGQNNRLTDEPGLQGWTVNLYQDVNGTLMAVNSEVTVADGSYFFAGLAPEVEYVVRQVPPNSDWTQTKPAGIGGGDYRVTLSAGASLSGIDFGNDGLDGIITGRVWDDKDGDGVWDDLNRDGLWTDVNGDGEYQVGDDEPLLTGWTVFVDVDGDGQMDTEDGNGNGTLDPGEDADHDDKIDTETTTTGADGVYTIEVPPSESPSDAYTVSVVVPNGWVATNPTSGSRSVNVDPNQEVNAIDFGYVQPATVTGTVWDDKNGNGQFDPGSDVGMKGWTVYLDSDDSGTLDPGEFSVTTGDDGSYTLSVLPGNVTLREVVPAGWFCQSPADAVHRLNNVVAGTAYDSRDFFNVLPATITGVVWDDVNADGKRDASETVGLAGWRIYADRNRNGALDPGEVAAFSDSNGNYSLTVVAGSYEIRQILNPGYLSTAPEGGSYSLSAVAGETYISKDFGDTIAGYIQGTLWNDLNGDGLWTDLNGDGLWTDLNGDGQYQVGDDEPLLEDWTVFLDDNGNGTWEAGERKTTTNDQGAYQLEVVPGTYTVCEVLPTDKPWMLVSPREGFHTVTVVKGQPAVTGKDFGNVQFGIVKGQVWNDRDMDGQQGQGESGLEGWKVYVDLNGNDQWDGTEPSDRTGPDGSYTIERVIPGTHRVREVVERNWEQTAPEIAYHTVTVDPQRPQTGQDFGNRAYGSITGIVWYDADRDKALDVGEKPVSGKTLDLFLADEFGTPLVGYPSIAQTHSDSTGYYVFSNIPADYIVRDGNGDISLYTTHYLVREQLNSAWMATVPWSENGLYAQQVVTFYDEQQQFDPKTANDIDFGNQKTGLPEFGPPSDTPPFIEDSPEKKTVSFTVSDPLALADWPWPYLLPFSDGDVVVVGKLGVDDIVGVTSSDPAIVPNDIDHLSLKMTAPLTEGAPVDCWLSIKPAPNAYGETTITVTVTDGWNPKSYPINVTVIPVNDPPSFAKGADQTVKEDAGPQSVTGWARNISKGPANESDQNLTFIVTTDNDSLFLEGGKPAISDDGTLTYTPAPDAYGTATVTVQLNDHGGGTETSDEQTFTITVNPVNDAPTLNAISNPAAVLENASQQTIGLSGITAGGGEPQTLRVTATTSNSALTGVPAVAYVSAQATGTVSYTPVAGKSGTATITVTVRDAGLDGVLDTLDDGLTSQSFTVTVSAVNDPPTLDAIDDPAAVMEDASQQTIGLSGISAGGGESQTLRVTATTTNSALTGVPTVAYVSAQATGSVSYTPVADQSGTATITVTVTDAGLDGILDTADDGLVSQPFTVTISSVNDAPSFTKGINQAVNEESGPQTVTGWATNISAGPSNESDQTLTFEFKTDNDALFSVLPAISVEETDGTFTGTLTYTPAPNAFGTATVTVSLTDNGGDDTSDEQTFTITVRPVNDAPSFDLPAALEHVDANAGAQVVSGWATNISAGPSNESGQMLTFLVTTDNDSLFLPDGMPAISADGTLTFAPAPNASGTATVTVQLRDNGGTDNRGSNLSGQKTFTIGFDFVDALGVLGMQTRENQDATTETLWYFLQTGRAGILTAQVLDGAATLVLCDENRQPIVSTTSTNPRIDYQVDSAGEIYYLSLSEASSNSVELRVLNLVALGSEGELEVFGTAGDDTLEIDGATGQITINGVDYPLSPTSNSFDGGEGSNRVEVRGTSTDDQWLFNAGTGYMSLNALSATFVLAHLSELSFDGRPDGRDGLAGLDTATLIGTSGRDELKLGFNRDGEYDSHAGQLQANGLLASVSRMTTISAYGAGGNDGARLSGSEFSDRLTMWPRAASLADSTTTYSYAVNDFPFINVEGRTGTDQATMYDSASNDVFESKFTHSRMYSAARMYSNWLTSFERIYANASTGNDIAWVHGSDGSDLFVATPTYSTMSTVRLSSRVRAFDYVYGVAGGGNDLAKLFDSDKDDAFTGRPTESTMQGTGYVNRAKGFDTVEAYATRGYDRAFLYDSTGVDTLEADRYSVKLYNAAASYSVLASSFDRIYAYSGDATPRNIKKIGSGVSGMLFMYGVW